MWRPHEIYVVIIVNSNRVTVNLLYPYTEFSVIYVKNHSVLEYTLYLQVVSPLKYYIILRIR